MTALPLPDAGVLHAVGNSLAVLPSTCNACPAMFMHVGQVLEAGTRKPD
jgi:hypothetical protein